ncbi:MAG: methylcrotonoyl-CoA carboxylase [Thermotogae bacterium]|nr:methylcrotonoyl-CoA carboxylase [Thermotogota bacterium]
MVLRSRITTSSAEFKENYEYNLEKVKEFRAILEKVRKHRSEKAVKLHRSRGKLLARERIEKLLDPNSPFLELSPLAAYGMYNDEVPQAGIITGIGLVEGKETVVVANDATVKGGTYFPETIKKHIRAQEIALQNRIPIVYLVDSGGVFLPMQSEVFPDRFHFGRIFYNQAVMSSLGIPQISAVMGMCTAGGAYVPAMSDENVIVKGTGTIYLAGPPLVKAATGEEVDEQTLGGGVMHSSVSGVTDHLAENDEHAIAILRSIFRHLNWRKSVSIQLQEPEDPLYDPREIYGILPKDPKQPFDMREIIARIVDGSRFHEFKANYGSTLITGFAHINGIPVGILANNGVLFSESALKGAHFIMLADQRRIPLIFLQNITGFMVGSKYEREGITKHGAKMVQAVSTATVPKITVIVGGSHGAGNYAMAGRAYEPRFLFMYPTARISVMGAEQAATVMEIITERKYRRQGKELTEEERKRLRQRIIDEYGRVASAYYSTARLWDDGIIDPAQTREILTITLSVAINHIPKERKFPVFRF